MLSTRVLENGLWSYDLLRTVSKRIIAESLIEDGELCQAGFSMSALACGC
jgi:hypothetical protein